jgi:predicted DNA-binding ribbon-helix-helix protein
VSEILKEIASVHDMTLSELIAAIDSERQRGNHILKAHAALTASEPDAALDDR